MLRDAAAFHAYQINTIPALVILLRHPPPRRAKHVLALAIMRPEPRGEYVTRLPARLHLHEDEDIIHRFSGNEINLIPAPHTDIPGLDVPAETVEVVFHNVFALAPEEEVGGR
jgi:hypothetical protein